MIGGRNRSDVGQRLVCNWCWFKRGWSISTPDVTWIWLDLRCSEHLLCPCLARYIWPGTVRNGRQRPKCRTQIQFLKIGLLTNSPILQVMGKQGNAGQAGINVKKQSSNPNHRQTGQCRAERNQVLIQSNNPKHRYRNNAGQAETITVEHAGSNQVEYKQE